MVPISKHLSQVVTELKIHPKLQLLHANRHHCDRTTEELRWAGCLVQLQMHTAPHRVVERYTAKVTPK